MRCRMRCWHASAEGLGPRAGGTSVFGANGGGGGELFWGDEFFGEDGINVFGMKDHPSQKVI